MEVSSDTDYYSSEQVATMSREISVLLFGIPILNSELKRKFATFLKIQIKK